MSLPSFCLDKDVVLKDFSANIKWRNGVPNYKKANTLFEAHKSTDHPDGSLQWIVQNLVKNWEKEASHKMDPLQWVTIDPSNYRFSCNGQQKYNAWETVKVGTYNVLIGQTNYYDANAISFEESHVAFKRAFGDGFAWEVLEVYSGPPTVTFTWRHFGRMTDYFSCTGLSGLTYKVDPTNKMVKLYGMCKASINEKYQIQDLQVFYDPNQLFTQLTEVSPFAPFSKMPATTIASTRATGGKQLVPGNSQEKAQPNGKTAERYATNAHSSVCTIS